LDSLGKPFVKEHLQKADYVGFIDNTMYKQGLESLGLTIDDSNFPYSTESHMAHWQLVKVGAAIGVMPDYMAKQEPLVTKAFNELPSFPIETWLVVHKELRTNRRIQVVYNFLHDELTKIFNE